MNFQMEKDDRSSEFSADNAAPKPQERRERSSIEFPYNDLDDAIDVVRNLQQYSGTSACSLSDLAASMGMSASGGGFRLKVSAARIFGLSQSESRGRIQLTSLGSKVLNPEHETNARIEAFLNVALYEKLYESRKGHPLPGAPAIEREITSLGVPQKQKARARQVFERSAQQAGFIQQGTGRLVRPPMIQQEELPDNSFANDANSAENRVEEDSKKDLHPFVVGLLETLPQPNTEWPHDKREEWLNAAKQIFKLIYKEKLQTRDQNTHLAPKIDQ